MTEGLPDLSSGRAEQTDVRNSDPELAAAIARMERLACAMLHVQSARIVFGTAADAGQANPATDPAKGDFQVEQPLSRRDGSVIGIMLLRDSQPRPPLSPAECAVLEDLAVTAVQAWDLHGALAEREQDLDRLALRERLQRAVTDSPNFAVAVQTTMAMLREATHCMLCLFFRLDKDGEHMHLVAGQASTPDLTEAYVAWLRQTIIRTDNSLVGHVAVTGEQQVIHSIDQATRDRYPAIGLSVMHRIDAQIVTAVSLESERYAFGLGFEKDRADLLPIAAMLADLAGSLRPLLRRLRDAEQIDLFRRVVEASHNSVMISIVESPVPCICHVNAAFSEQTGYTLEEAMGRPSTLLQDEDAAAEEVAAIAAGRSMRRDVLNRRRDGSRFWVDQTMAPVVGITGAITHWVTIERDITERKLAQEAIALNEQRFRLVARATAEVVWDWDLAADTIWWSEGMQAQFGHGFADARCGLDAWVGLLHEADRARIVEGRCAAIAATRAPVTPTDGQPVDGQPVPWQEEYRFRKADGAFALVLDRGHVIADAEGRPVRMVGSLVDITRQRKLEEELRQSQRLDAVGRLTGGVAHDFNNLLAVIMGNAELMRDQMHLRPSLQDRTLAEGVDTILRAADRGADLTNRLLAFARLHPLNPRPADVNLLLFNVEALARRLVGVAVEMTVQPLGEDAAVVIDAPQLENALLNLCINARDAMPDGGRLSIGAALHQGGIEADNRVIPPGDYVAISVRDTGVGMTPDVLSRAFEPFFTTKDFGKGSGLGLSMVFGFVSQSNGHVGIRSAPGQGTCITLYLPRSGIPAKAVLAGPAGRTTPGGHGRILVVEDEELLRQTVATQLARLGYQVLVAPDARAAMELVAATADLALVFTDVVLPGGVSGFQLARRAQALRPGLLVLLTSGYPDNAEMRGVTPHHGLPILHKPYRISDLAERIDLLLRRARPGGKGEGKQEGKLGGALAVGPV